MLNESLRKKKKTQIANTMPRGWEPCVAHKKHPVKVENKRQLFQGKSPFPELNPFEDHTILQVQCGKQPYRSFF